MISLIPKIEVPMEAGHFRPISCCNVLYKIISKMICVRLREAMGSIVAGNQAVFVKGRSLVHNMLVCHDILRHYSRKTTPRCMLKIDLKKAYDMVSWEFIAESLEGYSFPRAFIAIVMKCVASTKFPIKVNGEGHGYFEGRRGLRQGDPMSPLLFVLVMEYFSRTLKKIGELPDFKYHPMCKQTKLTHLLFADDLMLFCKGDMKYVSRLMEAHYSF